MDADLYKAAIEGDISGIEKLSEKVGQVTEEDGSTILHLASGMGKTECVRFILIQFANEELLIKIDRKGRTALHYAAQRGYTDAVELLINAARGLLPSSEFEQFIRRADDINGDTALHRAVVCGNVEAVKLLVKADPNHKHSLNNKSESPLYKAADRGNSDIVKVICESCSTPTFDGYLGQTALHVVIRNIYTEREKGEVLELLINAARGFLPPSEFEEFIRRADDINGDTALHRAVYENKVEAVKLLVKADPNHKHSLNKYSYTPLYIAVDKGYNDIVKVILESCATPTFDGPNGKTALHAAIENSYTVELLINVARGLLPSSEFEKFIRHADDHGDTALHRAVFYGNVEAVKLLVKADPNHKHSLNKMSKSPLYIAAEQGYADIVKVIFESCATPTFDGPNGKTALHAAIENSYTVELLINAARGLLPSSEFEKFIRHADDHGDTALHRAVYQNKVEAVKLLVKADPYHKYSLNKMSKSPLYIAAEQGYMDIGKVICESCTFPSFGGPAGETALHAAFDSPNTGQLISAARGLLPSSEFEKLIRHANDHGDTALHRAVYKNKVEAVKLLVNADPNHKHSLNKSSKSPLYIAVERGYKDIVKVILESCTTPSFGGSRGKTALHAAIASPDTGEIDAVELLINVARRVLPSLEFKKFIGQADVDGDTALHLAVRNNNVETVKLLVKDDPNHKYPLNDLSKTQLYIAAERGYKDIVKVICGAPKFDGKTALHAAIENSDTEDDAVELINVTRGLLSSSEFEKFIRHADDNGDTALHMAVERNRVELVKLLLKVDPTQDYSESGKTSLHLAAENGDKDSVKLILDKRQDLILKRDDRGWTAADYAASKNFLSILDILIKTENNQFFPYSGVYKQFFMGRPHKETAIHRAAFEGHISTVLQLMKLYPEFIWSAVNEHGQNVLHIAVDRSHKELVQAIQQHCPNLSQILNTKDKKGNTPLHLLVMKGCFIPEIIRHERVDRNAKNNDNFTPYDVLYLDQGIVADQLKIKEALEDSEFINQRWNFGLRKSKQELVSAESPVFPSTRYAKDAKFKEARDLLIKEEINLYRARINTQIIVTALITTVTFTVGFTMPGGYHQSGEEDEGSALLSKKVAFNVFVLADTVALLLSMSSLALYFVASMYQDAEAIAKLVDASTVLNIISVVATMLTFVMGICLVLPHSSALLISVGVMSAFFILLIVLLLIVVVKDPVEKFRE